MPRKAGALGPGRSLGVEGYVKITAGPDRHQWEHRVVSRAALDECKARWPTVTWHVDHSDGRRAHNCLENLILMDHRINVRLQRRGRRVAEHMALVELLLPGGGRK